jgi:ribosomal-protein-alanine N-acetyltransferase
VYNSEQSEGVVGHHVWVRPFTDAEARHAAAWTYPPPYDLYDSDPTNPSSFTVDAQGYGYYAVVRGGMEGGGLLGFCCFGAEASVAGQSPPEPGTLDIGGGLRPELTGRGVATAVFPAIVGLAVERFAPSLLRTVVAVLNERALRLCRGAGFEKSRRFPRGDGREFWELVRTVSAGSPRGGRARPR